MSDGFDNRTISDGPVTQLQWMAGMNFISASTFNSVSSVVFMIGHNYNNGVHVNMQVIQIPIANCSSCSNCSSCLGNRNPLCGWCVVENKCSQENECQNPETRWIRAAGTSTGQCTTLSVTPQQFDLDAPEIVKFNFQFSNLSYSSYELAFHVLFPQLTLTISQPLPPLLISETYLCHFASGGVTFTVEAIGSGTNYTCNVIGETPSEFEGLSKGVHS